MSQRTKEQFVLNPVEMKIGDLTLLGLSLAGIRTSLVIPELGLCFDVAQGLPFAVNSKFFLISHSHMDHASGIPYLISQRGLNGLSKSNFYMPEVMISPMTEIMNQWSKLDQHAYNYSFSTLKEGDRLQVNAKYYITSFPTIHRVPSQGYCLWERKKQLRQDLKHLSEKEIIELKRKGQDVNEELHHPVFAFTGDTQIEVFDQTPILKQVDYLFTEVTYLDEKRTRAQAKEWGHIHLDELIERLDQFQNLKVIMSHISSRYSINVAEEILDRKIPENLRSRFHLFKGR